LNKYICHPNGNDLNGGGFYATTGGTPTPPAWSDWHNNFAPTAIVNNCSIESWGASSVKIVSEGAFSASMVGSLVYCDFSDTYNDGRYVVVIANTDYIGIGLAYSSAVPTVNVRVGGAIKSPKEACALGNGTSDDEVLFPCNQSTPTIHEINGSSNNIALLTNDYTLNAYGVDEATGVAIISKDSTKWPVIKAKDGSSWTYDVAMLSATASPIYVKLDKLLFDGNQLATVGIRLGDNSADIINIYFGDIEVKNMVNTVTNALPSPITGKAILAVGYLCNNSNFPEEYINSLKISNCGIGINPGTRTWPPVKNLIIDSCTCCAIFQFGVGVNYLFQQILRTVLSNNAIGIYKHRYNLFINNPITFIGNGIDIYFDKYSTFTFLAKICNCLFFNDNAEGKIVNVISNSSTVIFDNCVLGTANGAVIDSGVTSTKIDCELIHSNPLMSDSDLRLNPAFEDFSKIYDYSKTFNYIGATSIAEPVGGGGGCFVQAGSGRFGVQES